MIFVLIVWCLTSFSTVFQLSRGSHCTYPYFPGVPLTSTSHNILSKPLAIVETMNSSERGMNPIAMTIKNPRTSNLILSSPLRY